MLATKRLRTRAVVALAVAAILGVSQSIATASADVRDTSAAIRRDCRQHGDALAHDHELKALREARNTLTRQTACGSSVRSQIAAKTGTPSRGGARAVYADFFRHGALTHRYKLETLLRARRHLSQDARDYSFVAQALTSQISALREHE